MAESRGPLTPEEELDLHRRLVEEDPVAPSDLATTYLVPLLASLTRINAADIHPDFIQEAVHEALINLIKNPRCFDAPRSKGRLPLFAFLRLAAQRDLQNILRREGRHWRHRVCLESVELSPLAGKYPGKTQDPS